MSRATSTREQVRKLAEELTRKGETPTPTRIRAMLGGGSPNTIVSELKAWQQARVPASAQESPAASATSVEDEVLTLFKAIDAKLDQVLAAPRGPGGGEAGAAPGLEAALTAIGARFEGVQKYMLMQINEAREQSAKWQQKFNDSRTEMGNWQTAMRQRLEALNSENAWLRGRLNEPKPSVVESPSPGAPSPAQPPRPLGYSGHPKAASYVEDPQE